MTCCDKCHTEINGTSFLVHGMNRDFYICEKCIDIYYKCHCCGEYFGHYPHVGTMIEDEFVCSQCFRNNTFNTCDRCGRRILNGTLCASCASSSFIHNYSYKPTPVFHHCFGENTKLYAGIELEINFNHTEGYKKFLSNCFNNDFVYLKHDGSIGKYGVEIVSHPATFRYHLNCEWKKIFEMLGDTNTLGCGLHIHLSKNAFNDKEVMFLDYLVNNCSYIITQIGSRALKDYCKNHIGCKHYGYRRRSAHTDACNLTNANTIELRFCKSTGNYHSFIKKIKNIFAVITFVKTVCSQDYQKFFMNNMKALEKGFENYRGELLSRI